MERFVKSVEEQYVDAGLEILKHGKKIPTRTGIDCITLDHGYIYVPAETFPMLLGKKLYPKMALKEIVWFMLGRNDVQWLRDHGVTYWNEWEIKTEERARQLSLDNSFIGTIGKSYGYQWRNFGSTGTNQVYDLFKGIIDKPFDRRHIISSWCPSELHQCALPPCVYDWNFQILPPEFDGYENTLTVNLHAKARSIDYFLGLPYDLLQAYWFQTIVIDILNNIDGDNTYIPGNIHFNIDNFHIYENHIPQVNQYINNALQLKPGKFLTEVQNEWSCYFDATNESKFDFIDKYLNTIDFRAFKINHFGYNWKELPEIKAQVAV